MKKLFILFLLCYNSILYAGPSHCDQFVAYGYPSLSKEQSNNTPLCKLAFYTVYDNKLRVPIYGVEWLLPENLNGALNRVSAFKQDPSIPLIYRTTISDYKASGFDKGHIAPVEDMRKDSVAMLESFYFSNIAPQNSTLNRGLWKTLESHTRNLSVSLNGVYVITGTVFSKTSSPVVIGKHKVGVPTHFYKVIIDKTHNEGIGYLVPNTTPVKGVTYKKFAVSIKDVEAVTGINFTPTLDPTQSSFKGVIAKTLQ
jgi:endonuclease G